MKPEADVLTSQEFLDEVLNRWPLLEALLHGPQTLGELDESLSTSRSTIHRACQNLLELHVVEKAGNEYSLTRLGTVVTVETDAYRTRLLTARRLERLLNVVDPSNVDIPLEHFDAADVVVPQPRQAHSGLKRVLNLIEQSESLRIFSSIISPIYVDVAYREMEKGTDIEVIFDREVIEIILEQYVEEAMAAMESGNFHVFVGEEIPFEVFIADSKMGIAAHDESGLPQIYVETANPDAVGWANDLYERYKKGATAFASAPLPSVPEPPLG